MRIIPTHTKKNLFINSGMQQFWVMTYFSHLCKNVPTIIPSHIFACHRHRKKGHFYCEFS